MQHMMKMAAGIRDLAALRSAVGGRAGNGQPIAVLTRNMPARAAEIIGGGSLFWVCGGTVAARQRVLGLTASTYDDGSACARIMLAPDLVAVIPRKVRPFQGWRYLDPDKAPADAGLLPDADGLEAMPERMRLDLSELGLI